MKHKLDLPPSKKNPKQTQRYVLVRKQRNKQKPLTQKYMILLFEMQFPFA